MVGTGKHWSPFYPAERPVLADIIVDGSTEEEIARYYGGKFRKSALIDGAYEAEDLFPVFGDKWLFFTAAPIRDDQGNVTGAIESLRDITERKSTEEALRESEKKYRVLFETAKDAIFLSDEAGTFVDVNSAASLSLGYSRDELLKMSNKDVDADPIGYETFTKVRDGLMKEAVFEVNHKRKDGTLVPVEISGKAIETDGSKIFLAIARDITERKRADEKLKQTLADLKRSNTDLEQFAYVVSHDLQEPLRMVTSYVQLLSRRYEGKLDADANDFIGFAVDGASRMQTLIHDLLTYSRVGTRGKPLTPTDCEDILEQVLANLKLTIEDNCAVVTHAALPIINVDASQLNQLLQNLIGNAIKFHGDAPPHIHVSAEQKDGEWEFSVADNGIGIAPKFFDRIFVIFQRLHGRDEYSGTGIGLSVCKKIVERHGGRMWVESEPGQGATFYFTIPAKGGVQI
jgi:PAS domain S-box-containing protein